jgi:hypothetical protein
VPLEQWATFGASAVVLLAGVGAFFKWVRPAYKRGKADVISGRDALLGRDEVRDSITGKVLAPALPGMGVRMDRNEEQGRRQEEQMAAVVDAVAQIAPALTQLAESHRRQEATDRLLAEHGKQIHANAVAIQDLKEARLERVAGHIDSAAAWKAVEAMAKQDPTTD